MSRSIESVDASPLKGFMKTQKRVTDVINGYAHFNYDSPNSVTSPLLTKNLFPPTSVSSLKLHDGSTLS